MCIKSKFNNQQPHVFNMGDHILSNSSREKDLGVYIDDNLNFDIHINTAINKANKVLAVARKTFDHMDSEIFCLIFKGLVRPHLEYAASVWYPHMGFIKRKPLKMSKEGPLNWYLDYQHSATRKGFRSSSYLHWPTGVLEVI